MDISGPSPIETVGNCQKSGIKYGCGYEESPPPSANSSAEIVQMPFIQPIFQKSAGVIAGRGVALEINQIRQPPAIAAAKEMIVGHLVKRGHRGVTGNMAAHAGIAVIGIDHHGHGVPAGQALDAPFDLAIARIRRLFLRRNRIDVRRADRHRDIQSLGAQAVPPDRPEAGWPSRGPCVLSMISDHVLQRLQPMRGATGAEVVEVFPDAADFGRRRCDFIRISRFNRFHVNQFNRQPSISASETDPQTNGKPYTGKPPVTNEMEGGRAARRNRDCSYCICFLFFWFN